LLLNFNVPLLKQGVFRKVLGFDGYLPAAKRIGSRPPAGLPLSSINPAQDALSATVIGSAMEVNRELGPGLLASAYTACMQHELHLRNIAFESRNLAQIEFKGLTIESAANLDMIVDRKLALKIKSVDCATELHCAQLRAQMGRHRCSVGLLINFNHLMLIQGVHRFVC
jgi:GxxExxY protein